MNHTLLAASVLLFIQSATAADSCDIIYVAKDHINLVGDGSSWENAFYGDDALDNALDEAASRIASTQATCVDVWVAGGLNTRPSPDSLELADNFNLYGGFKVGDDFSDRRFACDAGDNEGRPCENSGDCPGGTCDESRVVVITGDANGDDGAPCSSDADCGTGNTCVAGSCLISPTYGPLIVYIGSQQALIDGLVFKNARSNAGSAVLADSEEDCSPMELTIRNSFFRNHYNTIGGAVNVDNGGIDIDNCVFRDNDAAEEGGAIRSYQSHVTVSTSLFDNNSTVASHTQGGALYLRFVSGCPATSTATIDFCRFVNNGFRNAEPGAIGRGGAIATFLQDIIISNSVFDRNYGPAGGALNAISDLTIEQSTFRNNGAKDGGALYGGGHAQIRRTMFENNIDLSGAPLDWGGELVIEESEFFGNTGGVAGALLASGEFTVRDTLFAGNTLWNLHYVDTATVAHALFAGPVVFERCRFINNGEGPATVAGELLEPGAPHMMTYSNCLFAANRAPIISLDYPLTVARFVNSTIAYNTFPTGAGAFEIHRLVEHVPPHLSILNSIVWGNTDDDSSLE